MLYTSAKIEQIYDDRTVRTLGEASVNAAIASLTDNLSDSDSHLAISKALYFIERLLNVLDALGIDELPLDNPILRDKSFLAQLESLQKATTEFTKLTPFYSIPANSFRHTAESIYNQFQRLMASTDGPITWGDRLILQTATSSLSHPTLPDLVPVWNALAAIGLTNLNVHSNTAITPDLELAIARFAIICQAIIGIRDGFAQKIAD